MASTQKKGNSRKKTPAPPPPPAYNAAARVAGGIVCALLALCVLVSYFNVDALLLVWIARVLKGTLGYGYYLTAPVLAAIAVIQLGHRGRPVVLRTTCVALLPLLVGVLCHLTLCRTAYTLGLDSVKTLWADGQALKCGGVLSGGLAVGCEALVSKVVSIIVFVVLLLAALLGALHLTPQEAAARVRSYGESLRRDDEDADDEALPEGFTPTAAPAPAKKPAKGRRRPNIDIPLDSERDDTVLPPASSFFPRRSDDIRTPDQVLRGGPAPVPQPLSDEPAPPAAPAEPPAPKKPLSDKQKKAQLQQEVESAAQEVSDAIEQELAQGEETYRYPPITLLEQNRGGNYTEVGAELRNNSKRLADTLRSFGVDARAGEVIHGPSVTRYEFTLDQGVKLSKITNLQDDIALALGASGVRIAPVPNKISAVGIEVPNRTVTAVRIRDVIESREFIDHPSPVAFAVGRDIGGSNIVGNIARLPHVLIAGTTGSGKSVCTNSLIVSLLYKSTPDEVRFLMIDPKVVELGIYNGIPQLLVPVVTDPRKAAGALSWAVTEMLKRYKIFAENNVRDLAAYNRLASSCGYQDEQGQPMQHMPQIVIIIDELADLMMAAPNEVEDSICRLAQMARAAGMHLVIATQRPSVDVITGIIKANIPSRIAFAVSSQVDSRTILDMGGAEKLLGRGDMLFSPVGSPKPIRIQGCFVSDSEIESVVDFVKNSRSVIYDDSIAQEIERSAVEGSKSSDSGSNDDEGSGDPMMNEAIKCVVEAGQASTSLLQRRLRLGYARAGRLIDEMEQMGIVGPHEGSKPRQVLITYAQWLEMNMQKQDTPGDA